MTKPVSILLAGGKSKNAQVGWFEAPENVKDTASYKYHKISGAGWIMSLEKVDMNNDGNIDLLVSDRYGDLSGIRWLENPGKDNNALYEEWKSHLIFKFPGKAKKQYLFLSMADFDDDGQFEIVFPSKQGVYILKKTDNAQQ